MFTCYMTNTVSDVYLFSLVSTHFTYFPQDVSETHTSLRSTELQLILRCVLQILCTKEEKYEICREVKCNQILYMHL